MAHLKMILTDDSGEELSIRSYELGSDLSNLDSIESEVEKLRPQFLGDLTQDLLSSEQASYEKKKGSVGVRGHSLIKLKTLNGSFLFKVRRYVIDGVSSNWLKLTDSEVGHHHSSKGLRDYSLRLASLVSYENSSSLLAERMGNDKLSDQGIMHIVSDYALEIQSEQELQISNCKSENYECIAEPVDIYSSQSEEIIFLSDGVCVSEQKSKRDKIPKVGKERTTINMMQLQTNSKDKNSYKTLLAAEGVDVKDLVQSECLAAFGKERRYLPIVAISDGARSIKNENKAIFGQNLTHILDWYHIQAKVHQLMSQIATSKAIKEECTKLIMNYLWEGKTITAVLVLKFMTPKNATKRDELVGYLEKNEDYIINYKKRKEAGKIIGSGRIEKENDLKVAKRQKRKALAWSKKGALNLALVTTYPPKSA